MDNNNSIQKKHNISNKIYSHFSTKYPETFVHTGLDENKIFKLVSSSKLLDQNSIKKLIDIIDTKVKHTMYQNNRNNQHMDTGKFGTDTIVNINIDKYLNNFNPLLNNQNEQDPFSRTNMDPTNLTTQFSANKDYLSTDNLSSRLNVMTGMQQNQPQINPEKLLENVTGAQARTDIKKDIDNLSTYSNINPESNDPFNENFPIRNRENDLMSEETKEFNYFIMLDSKDRNRERNSAPNGFSIEFSPGSSDQFSSSNGFVERGFGNISRIEVVDVILLDTSELGDSSDAGGGSYPYLLLNFDEIRGDFYGTNNNITKSFAILKDYKKYGSYRYYNMVGDSGNETIMKEFNPRINLNRLTTTIQLPDGTNFDFGSSSTTTSNTVINVTMKVTTLQKNLTTQFINKATY